MGTGDLCRVPPAAVRHGRARQSSGTGTYGDCRRVLWVPGPRGQYSGKICFINKAGVQDYGSRHVAKSSSDPRVAYPEIKLQVRDLVRVVGIVAPFSPRGSVFGKNSFYRTPWGKWTQETCAGCPKQRYAMGEPGKVPGPRGQFSGKISFYREAQGK